MSARAEGRGHGHGGGPPRSLWRLNLAARLTLFAIAVIVISAGISSFIANRHTRAALAASLGAELLAIVNSVAPHIDGDLHSLIGVDARGALTGADEFETQRQILLKVKAANRLQSKGSPIYTLRPAPDFKSSHALEFVVMTDRDETGQFFIGNRTRALPHHLDALAGRAATTGLYEDAEGLWISAAAPILDSAGSVVAVIQADRHIEFFEAESHKRAIELLVGALISTVIAGVLAAIFARGMVRPFRRLVRATEHIAAGEFGEELVINRSDEVGELAVSFNRMAARLKATKEIIEQTVLERTAELRASEARYRSLIVASSQIVWHTDANGSVTEDLPDWRGMTGQSREAIAGDGWQQAIHPDDRAQAVANWTLSREARKIYDDEFRIQTADGTHRLYSVRSVPVVDGTGAVRQWVGTCTDITAQREVEKKMKALNQQLIEISRQAGMAEVATGVLHNVGNVLNSVNISAGLVADRLRKSKVRSLRDVAALITGHKDDFAGYLNHDTGGQRLPGYLVKLADFLMAENEEILREADQLGRNIEHIKEIVAMQQGYATVTGVFEEVPPDRLVEDALQIHMNGFVRQGISIVRKFEPAPAVRVDKHKALQIIINLLRNAKHAIEQAHQPDPRISIAMARVNGHVRITVTDNGVGIERQNMAKIFRHGFTTKKTGHGFGLHSGALAAKEMGGSLSAHSDGSGTGATFTLELPVAKPANES